MDDLRHALRAHMRRPLPALLILITLGLGIGATSVIVTLIDAVRLGALPYDAPERLVELRGVKRDGAEVAEWAISHLDMLDWRESSTTFTELSAWVGASFTLEPERGEPLNVSGELISGNYFRTLGIPMVEGRGFGPQQDARDVDQVVILGYELWQRYLGGDPSAVGRHLRLSGSNWEILGIAPPGFRGMSDGAEVWIPLERATDFYHPRYLESRRFVWLTGVGRLGEGVGLVAAGEELHAISARLEEEYAAHEGVGVTLRRLDEALFGDLRGVLWVLLGGAAVVLLIACVNVSSLLLVRAAGRRREVALRAALGAGQQRLRRLFLVESLVLALAGGLLGVFLARLGSAPLLALSGYAPVSFVELSLDLRVLAVALGAALLCGLGFGLAPAWMVSRLDLVEHLKEGGKGSSDRAGRRFRAAVAMTLAALVVVLLFSSGLLIQGFRELRSSDLGYASADLLTLRVLFTQRHAEREAKAEVVRRALNEIGSVPGVAAAALSSSLPTDEYYALRVTIEDWDDPEGPGTVTLPRHLVSPDYFAALGIPLLRGRVFEPGDHAEALPVAVVTKSLAERYWPGQDPIGKRLKVGTRDNPRSDWRTVVGVVGDTRQGGPRGLERPNPDVYFPILQIPPVAPPLINFLLRPEAGTSAMTLLPALRERLRRVGTDLPPYDVALLDERIDRQMAGDRVLVVVVVLFAVLALVLAVTGIYGVISYSVAQRTREVGIRMALGSDRRRILCLVLGEAILLALAGIAVGGMVGANLVGGLRARFDGLDVFQPAIFAAAAGIVLTVTLAATWVPAWRASRVEPIEALRFE